MKKLSISNKNVYGTFQDILYHIILAFETFWYKNDVSFNILLNFLKNVYFIVIVTKLSWKALSKNYDILIKFFENTV